MSRYLVCTVIGTGADNDRIRAPYPTYEMIAGPQGGKALIAIPDEDFRDATGDIPASQTQKLSAWLAAAGIAQPIIDRIIARHGDPDVTLAVNPAFIARIKARIDQRYREHAGEYNPTVG